MDSFGAMATVFDKLSASKQVHEAVMFIENTDGSESFERGYGGKTADSAMCTASVGKLFTTTCILKLLEQGILSLDDHLTHYFSDEELDGLHVFKGRDYARELTVSHLLFQNSGFSDWFESAGAKKHAIDVDFSFTFAEQLAWTKQLTPKFAPGAEGRAYYADINFDMLGQIIERTVGTPLATLFAEWIFKPLGMSDTFQPVTGTEVVPALYFKDIEMIRPRFLASCPASGSAVTTARDLMVFLKAFFAGKLFHNAVFETLATYRKLQMTMGPTWYGGGYMQVPLKSINTLWRGRGELIGHTGTTGSFALYYPEKDLYFTGDFNQMANPGLPFRLVMRLATLA